MAHDLHLDPAQNGHQQLSIIVNATHDDDRPIFLAGNFNDWNTHDERFKMVKLEHGKYRFTFTPDTQLPDTLEYKFVKGGWHNVETDNYGNTAPNRQIPKTQQLVTDHVYRFQQNGMAHNPRFLPIKELLTNGKDLPGMRRKRNVWALLPYNYYQTNRSYPVLYLHDAQNLFDDNAPFGNWAIDRKLAVLAEQGMGYVIIIAIDHAGNKRITDFSITPQVGSHHEGRKYVKMISEKLKPYVDARLRTLPQREHTGIGGSSLGGLVSIYAGFTYPQTYSKLLIFSPSLWMNPHIHFEAIHFTEVLQSKIYLYAGGAESVNMLPNIYHLKDTLEKQGVAQKKLHFRLSIDPNGKHNEHFWGEEFPKAVEWLYFK